MDASALAELVRRGEASPLELVEAAIERAERVDPALNAIVTPLYERARAAAASPDLPDGPFRGVPFALKDLGASEAGMPQYSGNRLLRELDWRAPADTPLGARFRAAGFVTIAKTATCELGLQPTTQPLAFGPTRNPWDPARSPSGSSGGSAALVAAGVVPAAHANDGGGSIRMPASWCGLVGLKVSRGRTAHSVVQRNVVEHVVTRSVRDTAAILDAVAGPEPGDLYVAPPPSRPYADEVGADPGRLRCALLTDVEAGVEVDPACRRAAEEAGALLESLGHVVELGGPRPFFDEELVARGRVTAAANLRRRLDALAAAAGRELEAGDVEPYTWAYAERGRGVSAAEYLAASESHQAYAARAERFFVDGVDVLVTPSTGEPPAPLAELEPPADDPLSLQPRFVRIWCFSAPFNVTGQPAISLPLGWTEDGLPVGVQLVAAWAREDVLIRVAAQLETARPWANRRPRVHA